MKGNLASATIVGTGGNSRNFSREELKQLFTLNTETACETRELLSKRSASAQLLWVDLPCPDTLSLYKILSGALQSGAVTAVSMVMRQKEEEASGSSPGSASSEDEDDILEQSIDLGEEQRQQQQQQACNTATNSGEEIDDEDDFMGEFEAAGIDKW